MMGNVPTIQIHPGLDGVLSAEVKGIVNRVDTWYNFH